MEDLKSCLALSKGISVRRGSLNYCDRGVTRA